MHNLPEAYQEPASRTQIGTGVDLFIYGDGKGIAHWFKVIELHNQAMSNATGIECFDDVEMVYVQTEKLNIVAHQVSKEIFKRQPDLRKYERDYNRWKQGLGMPGTPLSKWDRVGVGQRATLEAEGIYTVEQVAEMPDDRLNKFPPGFQELREPAIQHVNAKTGNISVKDYGKTLVENQRTIAALQEQIDALKADAPQRKWGAGRPKKKIVNSVVIEEPEVQTA